MTSLSIFLVTFVYNQHHWLALPRLHNNSSQYLELINRDKLWHFRWPFGSGSSFNAAITPELRVINREQVSMNMQVAIQRLSTGFALTECGLALSLFCSFASFTSEVCLSSLSATDPAWPCHVSSDFSVAYYVVSSSSPLAPYSCFLSSTICSAAAATHRPPQLSTPPSVTEHSGLYEIIVKVVKIEK